nr:MAG TPA: hypothetical protein [Caudoviricetes sp.]
MHKFRRYLSMVVTFPAAIMVVLALFLMGIAGAVAGAGFTRTFHIIADEFVDALKFAKARLAAGNKR